MTPLSRVVFALLALSPGAAMALSLACAEAGYPRMFPDPIEYEVDKTYADPPAARARDAASVRYAVLLAREFDGKPLDRAFVEVFDGPTRMARIPLRHEPHEVAAWQGREVAFLHTTPGSLTYRVIADYGDDVCRASLRQQLHPDHVHRRTAPRFTVEDLAVAGVAPGDTEADTTAMLGPPASARDTGEGTELAWPGLRVQVGFLSDDDVARGLRRVFAIDATGRRHCTPAGICPGDSLDAAARVYGPGSPAARAGGEVIEHTPDGLSCWLQLVPRDGAIAALRVACQP